MHQTAQIVCQRYDGHIPDSQDELTRLPGIGANTAGSIAVFAYNQPVVFIETNIRSVFLHWFFGDREDVPDKEILPVVETTLDRSDPRQWYWALMDYGVRIKQTRFNPSRRSRHYTRQSPFSGSKREIRGEVIRILTESAHSYEQLASRVTDARLPDVLADLESEQLIVQTSSDYSLLH